jgi:hypothetical protein
MFNYPFFVYFPTPVIPNKSGLKSENRSGALLCPLKKL